MSTRRGNWGKQYRFPQLSPDMIFVIKPKRNGSGFLNRSRVFVLTCPFSVRLVFQIRKYAVGKTDKEGICFVFGGFFFVFRRTDDGFEFFFRSERIPGTVQRVCTCEPPCKSVKTGK